MYEQSLLCGIMNDWYGSMEDLFQDLKHYGFEVLESNRESITVSCDDDGDYVQIELVLGGTERTIVSKKFIARRLRPPVLNRRWQVRSPAGRSATDTVD